MIGTADLPIHRTRRLGDRRWCYLVVCASKTDSSLVPPYWARWQRRGNARCGGIFHRGSWKRLAGRGIVPASITTNFLGALSRIVGAVVTCGGGRQSIALP